MFWQNANITNFLPIHHHWLYLYIPLYKWILGLTWWLTYRKLKNSEPWQTCGNRNMCFCVHKNMRFLTAYFFLGQWSRTLLISSVLFQVTHLNVFRLPLQAFLKDLKEILFWLQCRQRIIWKRMAFLSMFSGSGRDKQFVLPKTSKWGIRSDSRRDEIFPDMSWWMRFHLKPARCVGDLPTPYGVNLPVPLSHSTPPFHLSVSAVKFEDCQRSRDVGFVSSDPNFSVRTDGTVYAEQEVANLSEPVQFMVTARGLHDPHIWETTVKLALAGHLHPLPLTKVLTRRKVKKTKTSLSCSAKTWIISLLVHKDGSF